ncbi:tripartite motif-containing protein 64-like [Fukomys damarensis]|uniref:tripartite motif-containing protein 64-like n=1 Tax=Fukomys damarensis TaxID=885580 RepID=UPI001454F5E2|nr:tripartite motif-containing protein 64-like [Fukomys damarensis]
MLSRVQGYYQTPEFKTDTVLNNLASCIKQARPTHATSSGKQICVAHREEKRIFCEKNNYRLSTNSPYFTFYLQRPVGQVRVFLDYGNESVSFCDIFNASLIDSFPFTSFP